MKHEAKPRSDAAISFACSAPAPVRRQLPPPLVSEAKRGPRTTMKSARPATRPIRAHVKAYYRVNHYPS